MARKHRVNKAVSRNESHIKLLNLAYDLYRRRYVSQTHDPRVLESWNRRVQQSHHRVDQIDECQHILSTGMLVPAVSLSLPAPSLTVLSKDPDARRRPSGHKATELTGSLCPLERREVGAPVVFYQRLPTHSSWLLVHSPPSCRPRLHQVVFLVKVFDVCFVLLQNTELSLKTKIGTVLYKLALYFSVGQARFGTLI